MNAQKTGMMAVIVIAGLLAAATPALAEGQCKQVKGFQDALFDPATNTASGTVRHAGWLNGTYVAAFRPGAAPTQDPDTVTFLSDYALTTRRGELKLFNVYVLNPSGGVGMVLGRINPTTSTGIFAGATGVLYYAGKVTSFDPFTVEEGFVGEVCFAR